MQATFTAGENLEKLSTTTGSGDFVHRSQTMGTAEGFGKVSKLWLDKCLTYEQGMETIEQDRSLTEDLLATVGEMRPEAIEGGIVFRHADGRAYRPTGHALGQVGGWAGCGTYVVELLATGSGKFTPDRRDSETLVGLLGNGLRRIKPDKKLFWRTRTDGTLRAVLSDRYAVVDNLWFMEAFRKLVPGGRLSHWRGDGDTIFGNVLIPDTIREESDSDYGGMVSVGNSEIGERRISSLPSVFRAICRNGCIWDRKAGKGIDQFHRGRIDLDQLYLAIRENLVAQIPLLPQGIDKLLSTRKMSWDGASMRPLFAQVATDAKMTKPQATALLAAYNEEKSTLPEYARTLFAVVNAVTRSGQKLDNRGWVRLDTVGGTLADYDQDDWASLAGRASRLKASQVDAAFASTS